MHGGAVSAGHRLKKNFSSDNRRLSIKTEEQD
jgi:hypothetical protein